jgi:hypothetical protein
MRWRPCAASMRGFRPREPHGSAEDRSSDHRKTSLASDRLRQLRDFGRFGFASEGARPRGLSARCASRRAVSPLQWSRSSAHSSLGPSSLNLRLTRAGGHGMCASVKRTSGGRHYLRANATIGTFFRADAVPGGDCCRAYIYAALR